MISRDRYDQIDGEDMIEEIVIRESQMSDIPSLEKLYPEAFPDEDLLPLVWDLLREEPIVLSLVGIVGQSLVGHVMFTTCSISGQSDNVALLGPLAVAPAVHRRGIGSALVRDGFQRLENVGASQIYVLGDPAYYQRFGFQSEAAVTPPYPLPKEWCGAWQSVNLNNVEQRLHGALSMPQPWLQPALWSP
jgi:putative acetyltransferase